MLPLYQEKLSDVQINSLIAAGLLPKLDSALFDNYLENNILHYKFDGTQATPFMADTPGNDVSGESLFCFKFKTSNLLKSCLFYKEFASPVYSKGISIVLNTSGNLEITTWDGNNGVNFFDTGYKLADGKVHFIVLKISLTRITLFVDGLSVKYANIVSVITNPSTNVYLGGDRVGANKFIGDFYKILIFKGPFTDQDCIDLSKGLPVLGKYLGANGVELLTNVSFSADTDWVKLLGVTISGGTLNFDSSVGSNPYVSQVILAGLKKGDDFQISYEVTSSAITSGDFYVFGWSGSNGLVFPSVVIPSTVGKHSLKLNYNNFDFNFVLRLLGTGTISIDNLSLKKVGSTLNLDFSKLKDSWYSTGHNNLLLPVGSGIDLSDFSDISKNVGYFKKIHTELPPVYVNNAAAIAGGLISGDQYRSGADPDIFYIVH